MKTTQVLGIGMLVLMCMSLVVAQITANAIAVDVEYATLYAGEEGSVSIEIDNNEDFDIESVSVALNLDGLSFTSVGSSEKDVDDIDEDDSETISFTLRPSTDIIPGDYNIPYTVSYKQEDVNETLTKTGSFGLRVSAKTDIEYSVETKDAIVGRKGRVSLKIVNKGLGDIGFVSAEIFTTGEDFEVLSEKYVYLGNIESDDSDLANFDVIFKDKDAVLTVKVEYKDFDNQDQTETINLPVKVYTRAEALELGLISERNMIPYYVVGGLVVLWFVWRKYSKYRKAKKRREGKR